MQGSLFCGAPGAQTPLGVREDVAYGCILELTNSARR